MSIFIETSQLQDDLALKEKDVLSIVQFAHSLAQQMISGRQEFWSLPDDRLLSALNADVNTMVDSRVILDDLAAGINQLLDEAVADRPELSSMLSARAPLGYGRSDVEFDPALLEFKIIPPAPPVP